VGSTVLFGLYLLFNMFSKEYINLLLTSYFLLFGLFALTGVISDLFTYLFFNETNNNKKNNNNNRKGEKKEEEIFDFDWSFTPFWAKEKTEIKFNKIDILAFFISCGVVAWYATTKHWIANNILGLSFSIQGIALLSLTSYRVGCLLLSGLFFYDIFWVFGTDVMVTVAKSFDAPIKLLFPRDIFAEVFKFSMLGLGDIVIPGVFVALMLRFDRHLHEMKNKNAKNISQSFPRPFFTATFIGYTFGLVMTLVVMHVFEAAQPALLYLVPACIFFSSFTAIVRGEFKELMSYEEGGNEEETKEEEKKDK